MSREERIARWCFAGCGTSTVAIMLAVAGVLHSLLALLFAVPFGFLYLGGIYLNEASYSRPQSETSDPESPVSAFAGQRADTGLNARSGQEDFPETLPAAGSHATE